MPKFKLKAYEEVYYTAEIDAKDMDEAGEIFMEELGDYHKYQTSHNFTMLEVKQLKGSKNA
jgi:hypothetical protein